MNILVINGSPKGTNSITFQTVRFLQKQFPEDEFRMLHVGAQIRLFERDMTPAEEEIKWADTILFCYPVYTFIAPSQLHRFFELLKEKKIDLKGKYALQITTSKHFYDITAHRYVTDNCQDLGMRVLNGFSADMEDLLHRQGREDIIQYWQYIHYRIERDQTAEAETDKKRSIRDKDARYRVVIVTDCEKENEELRRMIIDFRKEFPYVSHVVNLREFDFRGGCLGCFHCAADGTCVYNDGFDNMLRSRIQKSDSIVYAFSVKDHSMGALFKMYDDRQFCNGHRTVTMGKPTAYLVDGALSREENLRMILEARSQVGGNYLAGIATNEFERSKAIRDCASQLAYALENSLRVNTNFYGVGGMKIFRDLIFEMQGMMKADHQFYKEHHFYDFPQKKVGKILMMHAVGVMMRNPSLKSQIQPKMTEGMLMPYEKIINKEM
ncbi:MAG: NAD(P)H-dependent oxidoreductase [Lachnospiraceae bacterium]|nr:NAD(P)H-dependent oxidoreductase [Lachnospiraceae bacterium]